MGGRGASSGVSKGGAPSLDNNLIRRANAASFAVDAGDATKREYTRNVETISRIAECQPLYFRCSTIQPRTSAEKRAESR